MKLISIFAILTFASCSHVENSRALTSEKSDVVKELAPVDWQFETSTFPNLRYVYTPFIVSEDNKLTLFTAGGGVDPGNGIRMLTTNTKGTIPVAEKMLIPVGPDLKNYNYFRAVRVDKNGDEMWMITEVAGCYTGCDNETFPKKLASYYSSDSGKTWRFISYVNVDGKPYVGSWSAHTGLVWNPNGSETLDLENYANNRFITTGEDRNIFISNDGVNFKSIVMKYPFPHDRLIFTSMAKTPYGFHMMNCANWSDKYYTTTVRHLFSKDLVNWYPIESSTFLKNPDFYKGVHLSYDGKNDKLWAISPCGSEKGCSFVAWTKPKDYLENTNTSRDKDILPVGEFVDYKGRTAMIIENTKTNNLVKYKVRFWNGAYGSGYTKDKFTFPLENYKRQGCVVVGEDTLCVGDAVYINSTAASIMGHYDEDQAKIKFAIRYANGQIFNGFTREMFNLSW